MLYLIQFIEFTSFWHDNCTLISIYTWESLMQIIRIILIYIFLFGVSKSGEIIGTVRSNLNGSPVIGANVFLIDTNLGAATNYQGKFSITNVPAGQYEIDVQFVGYKKTEDIKITIGTQEQVQCHITLEEEILEGQSIVITGTRTSRLIKDSPVATEVIHANEIQNLGAENVGEVLEERAGIVITQDGARGGLLSAQLQGLDDNHTLVLVDGAPIIGRIAGKLDLSRLSIQNIERIEIVKGAASALYGSEAVGGVINIITKTPDERLNYAGNFNVGTFNAKNGKVDLSGARDHTNMIFSAEHHSANGYDLDPSTQNTTADDFSNFNLFGKIKHTISESYSLQASGEYFTQRQEGFDGGNRITDTKNWYFNLGNEWKLKDHSNFKFRLYHTQYLKNIDREPVQVRNLEKLTRGECIYNRVLANHIITTGGELSDNRLQTNRIQDGNKAVNNYSFYVQDEIFYKRIEFNLGIRADYHSQFDLHWSPKIGLLYKPTEKLRFRASFSKGFRAPDFVEMFLVLDHSGLTSQPYVAYGNQSLKPETSTSVNFGTEYHFSNSRIIKLNFFYNYLQDMISSIFLKVDENGVQYYTYDNLAQAFTRGLEADVILRFLKYYRVTAGYMFLDTKDLKDNEPFFNRPKHTARIKFDWDFERLGFSGNLRWRYIGDRLFVNFQGEKTTAPWYATWYTRVQQRIYNPLSIFAGVDNIFDYQNRNYVALPGRLIYFGIAIN